MNLKKIKDSNKSVRQSITNTLVGHGFIVDYVDKVDSTHWSAKVNNLTEIMPFVTNNSNTVINKACDWLKQNLGVGDAYDVELLDSEGDGYIEIFIDSYKSIKDSNRQDGWSEVTVGVTMTPCGVVNKDHTKFRPYLGHWVDGYDIYDKYGDYPHEVDANPQIKQDYADKWGVSVDDVFDGCNDSFEGGYLYTPGTELGDEVEIDPDLIEEYDGDVYMSEDIVKQFDVNDDRLFWFPVALDQ